MQITIAQLDHLLRLHAKLIENKTVGKNPIVSLQNHMIAESKSGDLSLLERKILDKINLDLPPTEPKTKTPK